MEDILASIRRIINEDEPTPAALRKPVPPAPEPEPEPEEVLELTEPEPASPGVAGINLSGLDSALEGLVRETLQPMLREWLDTNLPDIVRTEVAREITRIARRD